LHSSTGTRKTACPDLLRGSSENQSDDAGKHFFAEKPVAVDAVGIRTVVAATRQARDKGLLFVAGLKD
jgi:myo-inositol 2-dehydrogenase / D-chiro-inositol 1-dehydrogenase